VLLKSISNSTTLILFIRKVLVSLFRLFFITSRIVSIGCIRISYKCRLIIPPKKIRYVFIAKRLYIPEIFTPTHDTSITYYCKKFNLLFTGILTFRLIPIKYRLELQNVTFTSYKFSTKLYTQ